MISLSNSQSSHSFSWTDLASTLATLTSKSLGLKFWRNLEWESCMPRLSSRTSTFSLGSPEADAVAARATIATTRSLIGPMALRFWGAR